jgi:SAM-dependent methyltransferase
MITPETPAPAANDDRQESRDNWALGYAQREYEYAQRSLIPWLSQHRINPANLSIIDLGCLFGGYVVALARAGARCAGLDVDSYALQIAQRFAQQNKCQCGLIAGDLSDPSLWQRVGEARYDLVLLRDVIEHLPQPAHALANVWQMLKPGGILYLEFPPYYSPYGGHQQLRQHLLLRLPFMHLLPMRLLFQVPALVRKDEQDYLEDIKVLERCKLTIHRFEILAKAFGFQCVEKEFYVSRPIFKVRYGIPTLRIQALGKLPLLRELLVTGVVYLLRKPA